MGQSFQLVAPRAEMVLDWGGRLGEMLFDGSAKALVRLLTVPVRPTQSGSDRRVPQIAVGDTDKKVRVNRSAKRKADSGAVAGSSRRHKQAKAKPGGDSMDTNNSVAFCNLPCEVHRLIFNHVEAIEDILCLGLANQYLWVIGRERMHEYYMQFLGRWANKSIVCVGEDVEPDDCPPGLFSTKELDALRQKTIDIPYDFDYPDPVAFPDVPFTLHHFTFPSVSGMEEEVHLFNESLSVVGHLSTLSTRKDALFASVRPEMRVREETYFPKDQRWILRNLTTKQFVRSEAIALKAEFIHGPYINVLGFGEVVMTRIC